MLKKCVCCGSGNSTEVFYHMPSKALTVYVNICSSDCGLDMKAKTCVMRGMELRELAEIGDIRLEEGTDKFGKRYTEEFGLFKGE